MRQPQVSRTFLDNSLQAKAQAKRQSLLALGHVPLADAGTNGFKKVGLDVYARGNDGAYGNIWSVEEIDGEKWLVCYTDANDQILQTLAKKVTEKQITKVATTEPNAGIGIKPGDLVAIRSASPQSINYRYNDLKGIVSAAMPDKSELAFDDGSKIWVENRDLTPVADSREIEMGDQVRMFSKNLSGKVTKVGSEFVKFVDDIGQEFTARKNELQCKKAFMFLWTGETPDDISAGQKALQHVTKSQGGPGVGMQGGAPQGGDPSSKPKMPPPSIKQNPSAQEMESGSAVSAEELSQGLTPGGMPQSESTPPPPSQGAGEILPFAGAIKTMKTGRRMNIGDAVQRKSTGEKGTIIDINFDKKLGKFYLIDFGAEAPEQIFETDLQKLKNVFTVPEAHPFANDITPMRLGKVTRAVLDPTLEHLASNARDFVQGMVGKALTLHEADYPGSQTNEALQRALVSQAVSTYFAKYLPADVKLDGNTKNAFKDWLVDELEQIYVPETPPMQEAPQAPAPSAEELAGEYVQAHLKTHDIIQKYAPHKFASIFEKEHFVRQASHMLARELKISPTIANYFATSTVSNSTSPSLSRHILQTTYGYSPLGAQSLLEDVVVKLASSTFTTRGNVKYAIDLPGMESLRGGGGGYDAGLTEKPMGWEVKDPKSPGGPDMGSLNDALKEQLADQSSPLSDAPKLNIRLDQENQQIIIDYKQEEAPIVGPPQPGEEGLEKNQPSPGGPGSILGPKPGETRNDGGSNFQQQNIPVNF